MKFLRLRYRRKKFEIRKSKTVKTIVFTSNSTIYGEAMKLTKINREILKNNYIE